MEYFYYTGQVSCIDRQIAELEARRNALLHGYCFTGYIDTKTYLDPYSLDMEPSEVDDERQSEARQ